MTTPNTLIKTTRDKYKGIPPNIIAMHKQADPKIPGIDPKLPGIPGIPGIRHSKKKNNLKPAGNDVEVEDFTQRGPGNRKPAHSPKASNLFSEPNNISPTKPVVKDAKNIHANIMNSDVGLDNWEVLFANDVIIPVDNPMAPVLTLSTSFDTSAPSSRQPSASNVPLGRTMTNVFEPSETEGLSIQEIVRRKAEELMTKHKISIDHLFMDRN